VKDKRIQTRSINFSFEIFNINETKNREVTKIALLEIKINEHKKQLEAAIIDLNSMDMFLGYDWLVKHNPEVNWKNRTIKFMRYPGSCKMKHWDIEFKIRRTQVSRSLKVDLIFISLFHFIFIFIFIFDLFSIFRTRVRIK